MLHRLSSSRSPSLCRRHAADWQRSNYRNQRDDRPSPAMYWRNTQLVRLQLNPTKTEMICFRTTTSLKKIKNIDLTLGVGSDVIKPISVVCYFGVLLDQKLSIKQQIYKVTSTCYYNQLWGLKQVYSVPTSPSTLSPHSCQVIGLL